MPPRTWHPTARGRDQNYRRSLQKTMVSEDKTSMFPAWFGWHGKVFWEAIAELSRRYSPLGAFYRYGEVRIWFRCKYGLNSSGKKRSSKNSLHLHILEIPERRAICHVQIWAKLSVTNGGKHVYQTRIEVSCKFHGFFRHWMERESRAWRLQTRYGPNERIKSSRRGGKWRLLSKKGRGFVLPEFDGGGSAAATMVGCPWTARGEAPVVGRERTAKLRSSSSSIDVVKKVESRRWFGCTIRYDSPTSFEG